MTELLIRIKLHEHMKILSEEELKGFLNTCISRDVKVFGTLVEVSVIKDLMEEI